MDSVLGYFTFILEYGIFVQKYFGIFEKKKKLRNAGYLE